MILSRLPRPTRAILAALATFAAATACTPVPELEQAVSGDLRAAPYPALIPLEPALAAGAAERQDPEALERQMTARQARLKARAQRLQARPTE